MLTDLHPLHPRTFARVHGTRKMGHSAEISMSLIVEGQRFAIRGAGPSELVLARPAKISPGQAELIITIDGDERTSLINLSGSRNSESVFVEYTKLQVHIPEPIVVAGLLTEPRVLGQALNVPDTKKGFFYH